MTIPGMLEALFGNVVGEELRLKVRQKFGEGLSLFARTGMPGRDATAEGYYSAIIVGLARGERRSLDVKVNLLDEYQRNDFKRSIKEHDDACKNDRDKTIVLLRELAALPFDQFIEVGVARDLFRRHETDYALKGVVARIQPSIDAAVTRARTSADHQYSWDPRVTDARDEAVQRAPGNWFAGIALRFLSFLGHKMPSSRS